MSIKNFLRRSARTRKQKSQVERMSETDARNLLSNMDLSFEPMTDEQKQAAAVLKSVNNKEETLC